MVRDRQRSREEELAADLLTVDLERGTRREQVLDRSRDLAGRLRGGRVDEGDVLVDHGLGVARVVEIHRGRVLAAHDAQRLRPRSSRR